MESNIKLSKFPTKSNIKLSKFQPNSIKFTLKSYRLARLELGDERLAHRLELPRALTRRRQQRTHLRRIINRRCHSGRSRLCRHSRFAFILGVALDVFLDVLLVGRRRLFGVFPSAFLFLSLLFLIIFMWTPALLGFGAVPLP